MTPARLGVNELNEILQGIAHALESAERIGPKGRSALHVFVADRVVQALGAVVRASAVESDLLHLKHLFSDFESLEEGRKRERLVEARALVDRLRRSLEPSPEPAKPAHRLWEFPIQYLRGVGPKKAEVLARAGIRTVEDAVWSLPWRYEDRTQIRLIENLIPGQEAVVAAEVQKAKLAVTAHKRRKLVEVTVADHTGSLHLVWFNQPYLAETFQAGQRLMLYGLAKPKGGRWTQLQMENPVFEILGSGPQAPAQADLVHMGRIVPIYHGREMKTRTMPSDRVRAIMKALVDQYADGAVDALPPALVRGRRLLSFGEAVRAVHFPPANASLDDLNRGRTPGHRRFAFEDFLLLELALGQKREEVKRETRSLTYNLNQPLAQRLLQALPFRLTDAQTRVLRDIHQDLAGPHPMNRLIQGDVGCGKTVVAVAAMLVAVGSGLQAALMAPTEILAEQHYLNLKNLLEPLGVSCVLLVGGRAGKKRAAALAAVAGGSAGIVIGTHALIQQGVAFHRLGLAVIDEQHKFGVLQRATLKGKGYTPDVLVMTATPIPRTLALTLYGDLDLSVIDALPPGRTPIRSFLFAENQRARAYRLIEDELAQGRQAYVVFPLVEESEKVDLQAAITGAERLQRGRFSKWTVGLIHGRMKSEAKDRVMTDFKAGRIQVLVATTVIEVGIDVANATVMLIEHADRFGLAQLHQLRGRVGRGAHQSQCLLMGPGRPSEDARRRLEALVKSHDGFVIAEEDMNIRGPGEFFGTRQWGPTDLRVANLVRDAKILEEAREEAARLLERDPGLARPEHAELKAALLRRWREKLELAAVS
ncbi:MAG: ATP-dependent DNA helicase RecG [Nitrospirae bacterium]|nr:MAG: ATP-dependent DNA helicase RecG [Nitrospirota bacterium]